MKRASYFLVGGVFLLVAGGLWLIAQPSDAGGKKPAEKSGRGTLVAYTKDLNIYTKGAGNPAKGEYEARTNGPHNIVLRFPEIKGKNVVAVWWTPIDNISDMRILHSLGTTRNTDDTINLHVWGNPDTRPGRIRVMIYVLCQM
jgi:hypothetical protein